VYTGVCEERTVAHESEESPLLEAVTRERLGKTQRAGKDLAGAVVMCELWILAVALRLLVAPSRAHISGQYPFTNPNPVDIDSCAILNIRLLNWGLMCMECQMLLLSTSDTSPFTEETNAQSI
jgi:hypothetical protein